MGLPFYREDRFFDAVMMHVSYATFLRFREWENGWREANGFNCLTAKYYADRSEWCLADPEWSEAIMLAVLEGK